MSTADVSTATKVCTSCKTEKPTSEFYCDQAKPDGLYSRCKACHRIATEAYRKKKLEVFAAATRRWRANNPDRAREVNRASSNRRYEKDPEQFKKRSKEWYAANKERAAEYHKQRRNRIKPQLAEYLRNYYSANSDDIKARVRAYEIENHDRLKPINAERAMRRVARKKRATPAWADLTAIRAFYELAKRLQDASGIEYHVDHIVPLQNNRVCGLHVQSNLRVIQKSLNQSKGNRYWPGCPDDIAVLDPAYCRRESNSYNFPAISSADAL